MDTAQLYALYRLRWNAERQFMALKSGCTFNAGKAIKEAPIKNLLKLSTSSHHLKSLVAGAFHSKLGTHLSLLKVATDSGNLINDMLKRVLGVPNGSANHLSASKFEKIMLDAFKRFGVSSLSASNRALAKGVECSVQELLRPPTPGGSALS